MSQCLETEGLFDDYWKQNQESFIYYSETPLNRTLSTTVSHLYRTLSTTVSPLYRTLSTILKFPLKWTFCLVPRKFLFREVSLYLCSVDFWFIIIFNNWCDKLLYTNIDQTLVNSLHGLLTCEIGGLDCHVITTEYITRVNCIHVTPIL